MRTGSSTEGSNSSASASPGDRYPPQPARDLRAGVARILDGAVNRSGAGGFSRPADSRFLSRSVNPADRLGEARVYRLSTTQAVFSRRGANHHLAPSLRLQNPHATPWSAPSRKPATAKSTNPVRRAKGLPTIGNGLAGARAARSPNGGNSRSKMAHEMYAPEKVVASESACTFHKPFMTHLSIQSPWSAAGRCFGHIDGTRSIS